MTYATRTFRLAVPIRVDDGKEIAELTLTEPRLVDAMRLEKQGFSTATEASAGLLALLSGVPDAIIRKLKMRDAMSMQRWIQALADGALSADADLDADTALAAGAHSFALSAALPTDTAPVTALTLREPDVESAIAVERFKGQHERTAALIATLSGQIIPVVQKLAMRDVERIERWLDFFSNAGGEPAPQPRKPRKASSAQAGATSR